MCRWNRNQSPRRWPVACLILAGLAACAGTPNVSIPDGSPVAPDAYPFIAAIFNKTDVKDVYCGGTLIASSPESAWILTAAHCVCPTATAGPRWVVIGNTRPGDVPKDERIPVSSVCQYPDFSPSTYANDIAVIEVEPQAAGAALAALAPSVTDATATLLGWGETEPNRPSASLLGGEVQPILDPEMCEAYFPRVIPVTDPKQMMLCSAEGVAACAGDSGGPLLQTNDAELVQIGVAIYHDPSGCGSPTLYTRVSMYREWIESVITQPNAAERPAAASSAAPLCRP